jgi:hypothetical protein
MDKGSSNLQWNCVYTFNFFFVPLGCYRPKTKSHDLRNHVTLLTCIFVMVIIQTFGTMYLPIFVESGKLMLLYWMLELKYRPEPSFKKAF